MKVSRTGDDELTLEVVASYKMSDKFDLLQLLVLLFFLFYGVSLHVY